MLFWTACVNLAGDEMAQLANQGGYALHDKLIGRKKKKWRKTSMKKRKMNDDSIVAQPEFESEQSVMEHAVLPCSPSPPSPHSAPLSEVEPVMARPCTSCALTRRA